MAGRYKAYPEYKDSGSPWFGQIPNHWNVAPAKWHISRNDGGVWGHDPDNISDTIVLRSTEQTADGRWRLDAPATRKLSATEKASATLEKDDLLITKSSGSSLHIGKTTIVDEKIADLRCCYSNFTQRVRLNSSLLPKLCWYIFNNELARIQFDFLSSSTTGLANLNAGVIGELQLPASPIPEQKQIARFLDHETGKIDALIEKQQALIALLQEKRQAVISHAVTKGLNPEARMKDSGVEWLGEVPEYWEVAKLKHVIRALESGVSVNAADTPAMEADLGVLKTSCVYTRSFRVTENKTVLKEEESRVKCRIRKGSIIISRMNTPDLVGASAVVDVDCSNIYLPDRLWQTIFERGVEVNSVFIAHFMTIMGFRNQISLAAEGASSSMQNIAKEDYLSINVLLPSHDEQSSIVKHLETQLKVLDELNENAIDAVNLLQERRTALISAAVTGKIDVRDWEPASELEKDEA
tara:strand:+ start:282 stop:1685 length:1404 start_codon:yes stop_codon:yes gene_type:complete